MTLRWRPYTRHIVQLGLILVGLYLALRVGRSLGQERLRLEYMVYMTGLIFAPFLIGRPLYGLYGLCLTLLLIPFWVIDTSFLLSPNMLLILFPLVLLVGDVAQHKRGLVPSPVTIPLVFAGAALILGVLRYGSSYIRYPQIFVEAAVLFILGLNLFRTRRQILWLILFLAAAFTLRNAFELFESWMAFRSGVAVSLIRSEQDFYGGISTSYSELRGLVLPLFIAMFVYADRRSEQLLFGAATLSCGAWLGISGARVGVASMAIVCLLLMWLIPRRRAKLSWVLGLTLISLYIGTLLFPNMWQDIIQKIEELLAGSDARMFPWRYALEGFLSNPLVGSRLGPHHSYLLGRAQEMGLLFLMPFGLALWHVWRHTRWLQRHETEPMMRAFVIGFQASLLLAVAQNFVSTSWQLGHYAMFFWLLAGVQESLYYQARHMPAEVRIRT